MTKDLKNQMVVENKINSDNNDHNKHQEHTQKQGSHHHQKQQQQNSSVSYSVNFQYDPQTPEPGKATKLTIHITEQSSGQNIREFETVHDKLILL